jgi:hypothetical protein
MGEKKMAIAYAQYMIYYIFYLVAIVLATILPRLTEYVFAYKIVYFFKITIIVFMTGSVLWDFKIKRLLCHLPHSEVGEVAHYRIAKNMKPNF